AESIANRTRTPSPERTAAIADHCFSRRTGLTVGSAPTKKGCRQPPGCRKKYRNPRAPRHSRKASMRLRLVVQSYSYLRDKAIVAKSPTAPSLDRSSKPTCRPHEKVSGSRIGTQR